MSASAMSKLVAVAGLAGLVVVGAPAVSSAGGATLYALNENMKITKTRNGQTPGRRVGMGALSGVAAVNTPLCPDASLASGPAGCAINAFGQDDVSLVTGLGTLQGTYTIVVQGDNPVDGPEAVVQAGGFTGSMDFSPAIVHQIPYGTVVGSVTSGPGRGHPSPFTGVFRLPFAGNVTVDVAPGVTLSLRALFCQLTPDPNPWASMYGGVDLAYLDTDAHLQPNGRCLDIQPNELSLGTPLVRFDISF